MNIYMVIFSITWATLNGLAICCVDQGWSRIWGVLSMLILMYCQEISAAVFFMLVHFYCKRTKVSQHLLFSLLILEVLDYWFLAIDHQLQTFYLDGYRTNIRNPFVLAAFQYVTAREVYQILSTHTN